MWLPHMKRGLQKPRFITRWGWDGAAPHLGTRLDRLLCQEGVWSYRWQYYSGEQARLVGNGNHYMRHYLTFCIFSPQKFQGGQEIFYAIYDGNHIRAPSVSDAMTWHVIENFNGDKNFFRSQSWSDRDSLFVTFRLRFCYLASVAHARRHIRGGTIPQI